jgi:hypothetical protein
VPIPQSATSPGNLLPAEGMREAAGLQRREPWTLEELDDFVNELALPGGKLVGHRFLQKPSEDAVVHYGSVERPELIDDSTKLPGSQEHRVVLNVVDCHGSRHGVPANRVQKTRATLYFAIQVKMKKKAAALTAITAQTPTPIAPPPLGRRDAMATPSSYSGTTVKGTSPPACDHAGTMFRSRQ